ncbi:MAG: sulfite exporter TauE/SafE family protein [Slackia sp.]|uniref:sulfite exporter TauE/SafE family protein n=1 Tax=Slackia sp. CM382 TaxID=1111137 RepID=UPI00027C45EB|nr:sulfite exporter TauE/SafE family protein [Slackia sp. CM382]EJU34375.1 sulfite exporter TauE/SafE [Slackia sp. CM382]MDU6011543.1 sulfite exporter TauE/SafE family protein [Slackia sp.]
MLSFVAAAIIGVAIGILSGMLGIGGGTVMVPLFRLAFGLDPLAATATSLFSIIPTSLAGLSKHLRNGTCIPRIGLICGCAGACASPLGVLAATHSPNWAVMGGTSLVIGYSSITMLRRGIAAVRAERAAAAASPSKAIGAERAGADATASKAAGACAEGVKDAEGARSSTEAAHVAMTTRTVAAMIAIGLIAGFMGGYVGVGGGFVMVPLFISVLGISMREASGTSLVAVCILAVPGVIEQALLGNVHVSVGLAIAVGSMPGSILGASLVKRIPESALRLLFASFLLVVAVILVLNEVVG